MLERKNKKEQLSDRCAACDVWAPVKNVYEDEYVHDPMKEAAEDFLNEAQFIASVLDLAEDYGFGVELTFKRDGNK